MTDSSLELTHLESPRLWHLRAYRWDSTRYDRWGAREAVAETSQAIQSEPWVRSCFVTPPKEPKEPQGTKGDGR